MSYFCIIKSHSAPWSPDEQRYQSHRRTSCGSETDKYWEIAVLDRHIDRQMNRRRGRGLNIPLGIGLFCKGVLILIMRSRETTITNLLTVEG
jgi:hypothetical protein